MTVLSNTTIFSGSPAGVDHPTELPEGTESPENYLESLVGEGKKYKSADELAKAYAHLNTFTERIKEENNGLRTELGSKVTLEELVNKLTTHTNNTNTSGVSNQNDNPDNGERHGSDSGRGLTQAEVAELVRKSITEEQTRAAQLSNRNTVVSELQKAWGTNYVDRLKEVQRTLDVSPEMLDNLAATSPNLFLNAVLGSSRATTTPVDPNAGVAPRSSVNSSASGMRQGALPKEDWAYFEKLRSENPTKYWSPSTQNRMHDLAAKGLLTFPT